MLKQSNKWQFAVILCIFWTLISLSFAAISYLVASEGNSPTNPWTTFSLSLFKFYLWLAFTPFVWLMVKKFSFEQFETFLPNLAVHIAFGFVLAGIHTLIFITLVVIFEGTSRATPSVATLFQEYFFLGNFFLNVLLYAMIVLIVQAYLLYSKYLAEETRSSTLKAELADAQLQALKMQLQPHFLFNTLHSISSLNLVAPQKANVMIARLGEFLRMTLESSDEQMVTLSEELEYLRCYLEIEEIRFSDRLKIEFDVEAEILTANVPHLILQPIVENAVKYGIAPYSSPGQITISAKRRDERILLTVTDCCLNPNEKNQTNIQSNGKGLSNIRSRLAHLYEKNYRLDLLAGKNGGMTVELEIPLEFEANIIQ